MKSTFFVDVDGTLVNTMPAIYDALCRVFRYFGKKPPTFSEYVLGVKDDYFTFYKERIPHLRSEEHLMELWRINMAAHDADMPRSFEGVDEFLDLATKQDVELVLLSANGGPTVERWLAQGKRACKFSAIYAGSPNKALMISSHLEQTKKPKKWAYMIGDSLIDYHAAEQTGIEFVAMVHELEQPHLEHKVSEECLAKIRHFFQSKNRFVVDSFHQLSETLLLV